LAISCLPYYANNDLGGRLVESRRLKLQTSQYHDVSLTISEGVPKGVNAWAETISVTSTGAFIVIFVTLPMTWLEAKLLLDLVGQVDSLNFV
jgi:hypothetical protein